MLPWQIFVEILCCTTMRGVVRGPPRCFLGVFTLENIPESDQHRKDIIQQKSLRNCYVIGTEEQQLHKISHRTDK